MNKKIAAVAAVAAALMMAAGAAWADSIMGSAQVTVNGKPYVAGQNLKNGDQLSFAGPGFVKINGMTIDFTGNAMATYAHGVLEISSGMDSFTITDANGHQTAGGGSEVIYLDITGSKGVSKSAITSMFGIENAILGQGDVQLDNVLFGGSDQLDPSDAEALAIYNQFQGTALSAASAVTLQISPSAP